MYKNRDLMTYEYPLGWRILQGWPCIFLLPFGATALVCYAVMGAVTRKWYYILFGLLYSVPACVAMYISYARIPMTNFVGDMLYNAVLIAWLFSIVHCCFVWKGYMKCRKAAFRARREADDAPSELQK